MCSKSREGLYVFIVIFYELGTGMDLPALRKSAELPSMTDYAIVKRLLLLSEFQDEKVYI